MKHKEKTNEENKALATDIGDLFYDSLSDFLNELSIKLKMDSEADFNRGRHRLSNNLENASKLILEASTEISKAWDISKDHMVKKDV